MRRPGLDALRAFLLVLGVAYHATTAYLPGVGAYYHVGDSQASWGFVVVSGVLHAWRMPAFFLLAGLLAAGLLERRGVRAFVTDRLRRLMVPLLVLWPLVWATDVAVTRWGHSLGLTTLVDPAPRPVHLWFLLALTGCSLALAAIGNRVRMGSLPVLILLPLALSFMRLLVGEPRPADSFTPDAASVLAHGASFAAGTQLREWPGRGAGLLTALGLASCFAVFGTELQWQSGWAALGAGAGGVVALGLVGLALRVETEWRGLGWLLDSAYWLYLAHYPVVQVGHVLVATWPVSGVAKFAAVCFLALTLPLLSWPAVRMTLLGSLLKRR